MGVAWKAIVAKAALGFESLTLLTMTVDEFLNEYFEHAPAGYKMTLKAVIEKYLEVADKPKIQLDPKPLMSPYDVGGQESEEVKRMKSEGRW